MKMQSKNLLLIGEFLREHTDVFSVIFLCTHNARRSQLSEFWFRALAAEYGISVEAYSAGVEATRVHPHVVSVLREQLLSAGNQDNPQVVQHDIQAGTRPFYSKTLEDPSLPKKNFITVAVCDHAAETCPIMAGSAGRFSLPFTDPGAHDQDHDPLPYYRETSDSIRAHMVYLMDLLTP